MMTATDLPKLQIYAGEAERDLSEAVGSRRSAVTGEPSGAADYPESNWAQARLRLGQSGRGGRRECLAVGWKVVPVEPDPALARDFKGGQIPRGIAIVPRDGPASQEVYLPVLAIDDHVTEPNERFRIELTDRQGDTIWGQGEPDRDEHGFLRAIDPKAVVFTIHDTERDCARPGAGSGFTLSVQERDGRDWLVIQQPKALRQCAYIAWRYLDDTLPNDHPDAPFFLQGMAYFSSDATSAGLGGYQQWFDIGVHSDRIIGQRVRVAWGLGSDQPAVATLTFPGRQRR